LLVGGDPLLILDFLLDSLNCQSSQLPK
jgi:hypothetical protein